MWDLGERVEVVSHRPTSEVVIELKERSYRLKAIDFPGSAQEPLDFSSATEKLRRYAGPLIGEARVAHLVELVRTPESIDHVSQLAESIATSAIHSLPQHLTEK